MRASDLERQIRAIALLDEPRRRRLYRYVRTRRREVGRDEAARALHMSRALAAFHLDKLAEHGLLETSYRRLRHRRGPGAGRPAKLYRRSTRTLAPALPARRYDLAPQSLAPALGGGARPARAGAPGAALRSRRTDPGSCRGGGRVVRDAEGGRTCRARDGPPARRR